MNYYTNTSQEEQLYCFNSQQGRKEKGKGLNRADEEMQNDISYLRTLSLASEQTLKVLQNTF